MKSPEEKKRLDSLLAALRDDALDADGLRELEQLVLADEEALTRYVDATQLRNSLAWQSEHHEEETATDKTPDTEPLSVLGFLSDTLDQTTTFFSRPFSFSMLVAALTLGSLLTTLAFIAAPTAHDLLWSPDAPPPLVARLERTVECLWADADSRVPKGRHIAAGHEIRLRAGLAEVEFRDGTHVVLEGPVALRLDSTHSANLHYGRITAKSPRGRQGFTIETPATTVVDLGTEFGVHVGVTGESSVAVFSGSVQVAHRVPPQQVRQQILRTGEQIRITPAGLLASRSAESDRFVREVPRRTRIHTLAKIDITPSADLPLQPGFKPFVVGEETIPPNETVESQFGKISVALRGVEVALKPRYREMLEENDRFNQVPLLADLIFAAEGEAGSTGMDIVIRGLVPGRRHVVTIWSSDVSSEGTRISDWFVNDVRVNNDYAFSYEVLPKSNLDRRFSFAAEADAQGILRIEARRDAQSYINARLGPQPAVFLNALQIQELEPVLDDSPEKPKQKET